MVLLKRYGLPPVIAVALYTVTYALFGRGEAFLNPGALLAVLLALQIRVCDDLADYEADRQRGKAPLSRSTLIVLLIIMALAIAATAIASRGYGMLIPLGLILMQFALPGKYRDWLKPLFMPAIVVTLVWSFFEGNPWLWVVLPVLVAAVFILIMVKKTGRKV